MRLTTRANTKSHPGCFRIVLHVATRPIPRGIGTEVDCVRSSLHAAVLIIIEQTERG